jgi:hypothetical protein
MTTLIARSSRLLYPVITRESISWRTVSPGIVEIAIDLENPESEPTTPGDLVVETAALGAFVPFRPVTRIALGSLEPGGRRRVTTRVARTMLAAPTAQNLGSVLAQAAQHLNVPAEILDLMTRSQWAGNLNVYFDREPARAVEVHRALDLQVKAAQPILVMVDLPADKTQFNLETRLSDPAWRAQVVDVFGVSTVVVEPPAVPGSRAQVTIEATRLSDGRCVPVELTLETVAGDGGTLGCIGV